LEFQEELEGIKCILFNESGKSSLLKCLLRLVEIQHGDILIDHKTISNIKLSELRLRISIIPQDPILFNGTLRENLDPLSQYSDSEIMKYLKIVKMDEFLELRNENLEMTISNGNDDELTLGGHNFSLGQRQLLCLVRSMLKKSKILIMDEATSSVDNETDEIIQKTIREHFKDCTILVVAHRINTILDCDKILIMEKGKMVEFDSPEELLKNKKSTFFSLVQHSK
jgi:ATP-binding cassette, subfamily C (CFTR/MRP), member 1